MEKSSIFYWSAHIILSDGTLNPHMTERGEDYRVPGGGRLHKVLQQRDDELQNDFFDRVTRYMEIESKLNGWKYSDDLVRGRRRSA